jgi:hypothetical protein
LFIAVGRRVGYPLRLVTTRCHAFVRWDGEGQRFNIEVANQKGLVLEPDDNYRRGRFEITSDQEKKGCYLQSLTRRQELANFLAERAFRWKDLGRHRPMVNALAWASALHPEHYILRNTLIFHMHEWNKALETLQPPRFPPMRIKWPPRRFPCSLPEQIERNILGLEATENVVKDPELNQRFWEPMRRGQQATRSPDTVLVQMTTTDCTVRFMLHE